jgi:iron complex transport system ATP-binding protein
VTRPADPPSRPDRVAGTADDSDPEVRLRLRGAALPGRVGPLDWTVRAGEQWALLGANGAGKSSLLALAGAVRQPVTGTVQVLGRQLGRVDVRELRTRIGVVEAGQRPPDQLSVEAFVLTGASGSVLPVWGAYDVAVRRRAGALLAAVDLAAVAQRTLVSCSSGEQARARLARALLPDPDLLLLDEPAAGLDPAGRHRLLTALESLGVAHPRGASVLVTHHLEELPASTTHALLLRAGRALAAGPVEAVLRAPQLSECFGLALDVRRVGRRWWGVPVAASGGPGAR